MKQPKRYHIMPYIVEAAPDDSEDAYAEYEAKEALNGEWVKWEDVAALLNEEVHPK